MSKISIVLLAVIIWCSQLAAQNVISVHTNSTASGDSGTFSVFIKSATTVNGLNFVIRYDQNVIMPFRITPSGGASLLGGSRAALFGDDRMSFVVYDGGTGMLGADSQAIFSVEYVVADSIRDSIATNLMFVEGSAGDSVISLIPFEYEDGIIPISPIVGVKETDAGGPLRFELYQNYPNPFNPSTTVSFVIRNSSLVTLKIYDILGREVSTLVHEVKPPGKYSITWNASSVASGVYFCRMTAASFVDTKKVILMK